MNISDDLRNLLIDIIQSELFQQTAPLVILILIPTIVYLSISSLHHSRLVHNLTMVLEGIGVGFSWPFLSKNSVAGVGHSKSWNEKKAKKHVRTRAEQLAQNGKATNEKGVDTGYYPGLVNVSGTYCFMNSTLQALASLAYLQPHIEAINAKAIALDVPTPVIDALKDIFQRLNTSHSSYHSIRPMEIIQVLSNQTEGRTNSLFYSREHQDAQELFQVISECIKNELTAVDKEAYRDRGLGGLPNVSAEMMRDIGKSVFDGLTANRRSCCICGYTEAVMHFALDNWQLAVPRLAASCRLEDCLEDYTRLEVLKDCICRKCSILATHKRLQGEVRVLEEDTAPEKKPSNSKKERLKKVRRMESRVRTAIEQERIEDDIKDVRMEKIFSPASTKQAMIARPPPVLALHMNRSVHYGTYASKNNVRLIFPEVLDLTPYTTSGNLSTIPTSSISTPTPLHPRSTTPTPATYANPRIIYRLSSVVCHYGQHSFGHYICYRRKPRNPNVAGGSGENGNVDSNRWTPPKLMDPLRLQQSENGDEVKYIFEDDKDMKAGKGWLRISDDAVQECGIESVLQEGTGAFMLYYERAVWEQIGVYSSGNGSPLSSSEETLKPELRTVELNGSVASLVSEVGVGVKHDHHHHHGHHSRHGEDAKSKSKTDGIAIGSGGGRKVEGEEIRSGRSSGVGLAGAIMSSSFTQSPVGARIVRNVTTRRSRSAAPSSGGDTPTSVSIPLNDQDSKDIVMNGVNGGNLPHNPTPPSSTNPEAKAVKEKKLEGTQRKQHHPQPNGIVVVESKA